MKVIKISQQSWNQGIEKLQDQYRLFTPIKKGDSTEIRELPKGDVAEINLKPTRFSPKSVIFPQTQLMFNYSLDEKEEDHHVLKDVDIDSTPRAIIGLHPCDAASFEIAKRNFNNPEYPDYYWVQAYESLTLVGLACDEPLATCFCTSTGGSPYCQDGLDILLAARDNDFVARIITEKGEKLAAEAGWQDEVKDVDFEGRRQEAENKITSKIKTDQLALKSSRELFEAPFWDEVSFACLNCGTCTYSCPTCWCFDIQDEVKGTKGYRMRNWDSCMYPLFTLEASGHNPRSVKTQRVRQRFMHKLKFYLDKYQAGIQCVGCGRCIQLCPVNIDIRKVCEKMNQFNQHDYKEAACEESV